MNDEETYPKVRATTDWDCGLVISVEVDTEQEPIDPDMALSQFVATLNAVGFPDSFIDKLLDGDTE